MHAFENTSYNSIMDPSTSQPADDRIEVSTPASWTGGSLFIKRLRQTIIFVLGMSVLLVGIAMIVLPGPATVVIPVGLAILATEFVWARRWLKYLKRQAQGLAQWAAPTAAPDPESKSPSDSPKKHSG